MQFVFVTALFLGACGLLQAALLLLHAVEHWRFHRGRSRAPLKTDTRPPRVTLFVPCKGTDVDMLTNLRALFEQAYPAYEICFVVESADDPAAKVIDSLRRRFAHIPARTVVAGPALDCGQKVHNLIVATATIPAATEILAFADSDARPHRDWLTRLVARLQSPRCGIATGYRWYVPMRPTLANRLLSAINNTIVGLLGPHGFNLVWGGAWGIRRETFARLGLPGAWCFSLSDDLVVSRLAHAARLRVAYEPHCLVRSPAEFDLRSLAEFLRRQYVVAKVYAPTWWLFGVASALVTNLVAWGVPAMALWLAYVGGPWRPLAGLAALQYTLTACRGALAASAIRPFVDVPISEYRAVARLNTWAAPLVSLVCGLGLAASAWGRTITWRGTTYRLRSAECTQIIAQHATTAGLPPSIEKHRAA